MFCFVNPEARNPAWQNDADGETEMFLQVIQPNARTLTSKTHYNL